MATKAGSQATFSDTWIALAREASLAAEHMAIGVTALGRANYAQEAYYAQAFFALSVGFERAAKLALVVDHRVRIGAFPLNNEVRQYGHDIKTLLECLDRIAERLGPTEERLPHSTVHTAIIAILSDFAANVTRYYNLDFVTNASSPAGIDPLLQWSEQVVKPILDVHYKPHRKSRDERNASLTEAIFGEYGLVRHHSEAGQPINSTYEASKATAQANFAAPYVRTYVMQIVRFVARLLSSVGYEAEKRLLEDIPSLSEVFAIFGQEDLYFRRRKCWSIYKP